MSTILYDPQIQEKLFLAALLKNTSAREGAGQNIPTGH
jgi:hypothetical protein